MRAQDLTDEDIGRFFWVPIAIGDGSWQRICFEGLPRSQEEIAANGGTGYWMILKCHPSVPGALTFRVREQVFTAVLVRSADDVWPVDVNYGVSRDGSIVELGERAG